MLWLSLGDYFTSCINFVFVLSVLTVPILAAAWLLRASKDSLEERRERLGALYEETKYDKRPASLFHVVFFGRRLTMAAVIVFLEGAAYAQV